MSDAAWLLEFMDAVAGLMLAELAEAERAQRRPPAARTAAPVGGAVNDSGETRNAASDEPRPVTGLFHLLTPEQQKLVIDYRGPENHGPEDFRMKAKGDP